MYRRRSSRRERRGGDGPARRPLPAQLGPRAPRARDDAAGPGAAAAPGRRRAGRERAALGCRGWPRGRGRRNARDDHEAMLSEREIERYSRQLVLPEWSGETQERLSAATAVVIGVGALGSPAATYLAAAGVGRLGVVDGDAVDISNLQRQPLHFTPDVNEPKAESAAQKLGVLNTEITVEPYPVTLDERNAEAIVTGADVVVDCTDSFQTRYLVNDACCAQRIPLVEGGVLGFSGLVM